MRASRLSKTVLGWFHRWPSADQSAVTARRGRRDHVIILDGTMSSLEPGCETNAGLLYRLLQEVGGDLSLYYESGLQWADWRSATQIMVGRGINRQICRAYGFLASRYKPGDRIYFFGYSRGAFAVRSLAGVIDQIGLIRAEHATERNIRQAYRLYRHTPENGTVEDFAKAHCHPNTTIEVVGVWDTVKALGLRLPLLWCLTNDNHAFHNDQLGPATSHGFHALAYHEKRMAYEPVLWTCPPGWSGHVEQVWFRGVHGDIGGQLRGHEQARPLANIPLTWMLGRAEAVGLPLPQDWAARFPQDVMAPSVGNWRGWGKLFWHRRQRRVGSDMSERLHETLEDAQPKRARAALST
ncbi:DUF2235 domain-containing protein [Marivita hallyeonensis]|uniref:Uncharacterized alpha/beta hydrolase domain n=1 Tax=Marivita hallyeonensis TaxID=996342 RepID=A0A1M5P6N2_9RHOB|nr:DUF2235 domain-containing protein [Marivita hallyeonensis]SHG97491.1 Uncharacterized alpha/beta hydrolase domain [Marivita hallyeonensis]